MRKVNQLLPWEIKRAVDSLVEFHELAVTYFNNCKREFGHGDFREDALAREARPKLNSRMKFIMELVDAAEVPRIYVYRAPPVVGGYVQNVDLLLNIFQIGNLEIPPSAVTDVLERTIGIYDAERGRAALRAFNPFFWLGLLLGSIGQLPFRFLSYLGFDGAKVGRSVPGRVLKGVVEAVTFVASAIAILQALGVLESVLKVIR